MGLKVYIDFSILDTLASSPPEGKTNLPHWQSMRNIWRMFIDNKISLVTSPIDLETDIILWLNKRGCCITDTMRTMEAINEFERWNMIEKDNIRKWKRILIFFEQIGFLEDTEVHVLSDAYKALESFIQNEVLGFKMDEPESLLTEEDIAILNECSQSLHNWYSDISWKELKCTDYQLNWEILLSVLERHNIETVFEGEKGIRNRNLFGLWNRIVGLSKKSSSRLPLDRSHIDFILATVLKKYQFNMAYRDTKHILNCIKHKIDLFMTTDDRLIESFNSKRHLLMKLPETITVNLNIVNPSTVKKIMSSPKGLDKCI
jgi:hypothetical protein